MDDVCVADSSRRTVRSGALLLAAFAAVLLVCICGLTWTILRGVHSRIDQLSEHVSAHSVRLVRRLHRTTCTWILACTNQPEHAIRCRDAVSLRARHDVPFMPVKPKGPS